MAFSTRAIIFDLYGTLVRITRPRLRRALARELGFGARDWMKLVREDLLIRPYQSDAEFVEHILSHVEVGVDSKLRERATAMLEEELGSVEPLPEVQALVAFLKRRGYKLGLLSNLTSPHKRVLEQFALYENFAAAGFSCDEGMAKPTPELYLRLCERLSVRPEETLFVGDSWQNDIEAPTALGMRTLFLSSSSKGWPSASRLGWMDLEDMGGIRSMLHEGVSVSWRDAPATVETFRPLSDSEQGRYNLVAQATLRAAEASNRDEPVEKVYCKRFYFPEAAHVEAFSHRLMAEMGLSHCVARVIDTPEPHLLVSEAPGRKFNHDVTPPLAYEIGRHSAAAFVLANADLRPRNTFISEQDDKPVMTMVDLEHCFFALALDISGISDPLEPGVFDEMDRAALEGRIKRRVLTDRTTRRAMRSFFELESLKTERARRFRDGWVRGFSDMREAWGSVKTLIEDRVHQSPYLIIGTQSYRRAMAQIDIEEMEARLNLDAAEIFPRMAAVKS